jgi:hypothetical protein
VEAIRGLRTAGHFVRAAILVRDRLAAVVGTEFIAHTDDADVTAEPAFPRRIELQRDALVVWRVYLQVRAVQLIDQEVIHEKFASAADVRWHIGRANAADGEHEPTGGDGQ